jgi:thiol-disulfide isomerase/thioredoxin
MKKLLPLFIFILYSFVATSQERKLKVTDETIVKDSNGTIYPPAIWQALTRKGYDLRAENPSDPNTAFFLIRISEKEFQKRMEQMPKPMESNAFRNGQKVSFVNVTDMEGTRRNLKDMTGKITVINFWFINCRPCRMEIPELNELVEEYKGNSQVQFIAIALDEKYALEKFLPTTPFKYSIIDNGRFLAELYKVKSYPRHVIINQEGKVYFHTMGLAQNTVYWLKKSISELMNKQVAVRN